MRASRYRSPILFTGAALAWCQTADAQLESPYGPEVAFGVPICEDREKPKPAEDCNETSPSSYGWICTTQKGERVIKCFKPNPDPIYYRLHYEHYFVPYLAGGLGVSSRISQKPGDVRLHFSGTFGTRHELSAPWILAPGIGLQTDFTEKDNLVFFAITMGVGVEALPATRYFALRYDPRFVAATKSFGFQQSIVLGTFDWVMQFDLGHQVLGYDDHTEHRLVFSIRSDLIGNAVDSYSRQWLNRGTGRPLRVGAQVRIASVVAESLWSGESSVPDDRRHRKTLFTLRKLL